jgi:branched-chain amino acid transport system permease protein
MIILIVFIKKSKLGKSIRAVSQDKEAAELMGINVSRILMFTVAVSALLAGLAAILYAPEVGLNAQIMVWDYLLLSMSVVVLGGLGSIPGSLLGAFIISYTKFITLYYIDLPLNTSFSSLIHLALIIIVLIIRPRGILGKKERT